MRWARSVDGVVVEDDYDAEFRYDRRPVAALRALAPDRVALLGSLSKTLAAGFGVGWLVPPDDVPAARAGLDIRRERPAVAAPARLRRAARRRAATTGTCGRRAPGTGADGRHCSWPSSGTCRACP